MSRGNIPLGLVTLTMDIVAEKIMLLFYASIVGALLVNGMILPTPAVHLL